MHEQLHMLEDHPQILYSPLGAKVGVCGQGLTGVQRAHSLAFSSGSRWGHLRQSLIIYDKLVSNFHPPLSVQIIGVTAG